MAQSVLNAQIRKRIGTGGSKEVRKEGKIPAILYGKKTEPVALAVDPKELKEALKTESGINTLLELNYTDDGNDYKKVSMLREIQIDPITSDPIHLDFQILDLEHTIEVEIPIELTGRPVGVREGGVLMERIRDLAISCLPSDIPSSISVDVSELQIGDSVHVGDLTLDEKITVLREDEEVIAYVMAQKGMDLGDTTDQEEAAAEDEEGEEVEGAEGEEESEEEVEED